jgi:hypothetical protein
VRRDDQPQIAHGQVHSATVHGLGAALMESADYDASGNLLTSTFSDYIPITSVNLPGIKYGNIETLTLQLAPRAWARAAARRCTIAAALRDACITRHHRQRVAPLRAQAVQAHRHPNRAQVVSLTSG